MSDALQKSDADDLTRGAARTDFPAGEPSFGEQAWRVVKRILSPLASLKLTVALLLLSIAIVFIGTMAQTRYGIWHVIDQYFRCAVAKVELKIFFPPAWFPNYTPPEGWFPFPGGWFIGLLLALNLFSAHTVRFTCKVRGWRLAGGLVGLALAIAVTWGVINGGDADGLQGVPLVSYGTIWMLAKFSLAALSLAGFATFAAVVSSNATGRVGQALILAASIGLGALSAWLFVDRSLEFKPSEMRILWQLVQATFAGLVLLGSCILLFQKRAGIVVLHSGVGLMMLHELIVGTLHNETQFSVREGETSNWTQDIRDYELAVVDTSNPQQNKEVLVPVSRLKINNAKVASPELPFDLEVVKYYENSQFGDTESRKQPLATEGIGKLDAVKEMPKSDGLGSSTDSPTLFVKLLKKGTDQSLGIWQISHLFSLNVPAVAARPERVTVDGKTWDLTLRFKRTYKPYNITLKDIRTDYYEGTKLHRTYESDIVLTAPASRIAPAGATANAPPATDAGAAGALLTYDRRISMNDPFRFNQETFYQSGYHDLGSHEMTIFQVVANRGWMIPYVSCMIVVVGMVYQFSTALSRFLGRRARAGLSGESESDAAAAAGTSSNPLVQRALQEANARRGARQQPLKPQPLEQPDRAMSRNSPAAIVGKIFPAAVVTLVATYLVWSCQLPGLHGGYNLYEFGQLPVMHEGRVKPLDSLARNGLMQVSEHERFPTGENDRQSEPAIVWLLDLMSGREEARSHRVVRIDSHRVLANYFDVKRRPKHQYSVEELQEGIEKLMDRAEALDKLPEARLDADQRGVLKTARHLRSYGTLQGTLPDLSQHVPTRADLAKAAPADRPEMQEILKKARQIAQLPTDQFAKQAAPLTVPTTRRDGNGRTVWEPAKIATIRGAVLKFEGQSVDKLLDSYMKVMEAWRNRNPREFNTSVRDYRAALLADRPTQYNPGVTSFETYFNYVSPFSVGIFLYVLAFLLAAGSWLGWQPFDKASFWLLVFTLVMHTLALIARIYISGRPPVTNLYTSAIFIGWGCVLLGLIFEAVYKMGVGNVVASVAGFASLVIAANLATEDTFKVLEAVLDTQFWLATHVVCITMGYATTLLGGLFGAYYIVSGVATPSLTPEKEKKVGSMLYGILCFATLFSFFGTVLGGLWADDSWGRFWGWDPKENGALMIVLWNAVVLHAYWDKQIGSRGLAVMSLIGNVCTGWSWFGVNQLGVGLHSYGFNSQMLYIFVCFVVGHLMLAVLGLLPKANWWSERARLQRV